jgi:putative copper export protein
MLALPFTGSSDIALEIQYRLAMVVWVPLLIYLGLQQYATANRSFTDLQGSVFDNFSAIGTIVVGMLITGGVVVLLFVRHEFVLNGYQVLLEVACFAFGTYDYFFGSLFSQAIAGSTKGRDEE